MHYVLRVIQLKLLNTIYIAISLIITVILKRNIKLDRNCGNISFVSNVCVFFFIHRVYKTIWLGKIGKGVIIEEDKKTG